MCCTWPIWCFIHIFIYIYIIYLFLCGKTCFWSIRRLKDMGHLQRTTMCSYSHSNPQFDRYGMGEIGQHVTFQSVATTIWAHFPAKDIQGKALPSKVSLAHQTVHSSVHHFTFQSESSTPNCPFISSSLSQQLARTARSS